MPVAADNDLGSEGRGRFENSVVGWIVRDLRDLLGWLDQHRDACYLGHSRGREAS